MIKPLTILILSAIFMSACQAQPTQTVAPTQTSPPPTLTSAPTLVPQPTQTPVPTRTARPTVTTTPAVTAQPVTGIQMVHLNKPAELSLFENAGVYWTRYDGFHWDLLEPVEGATPAYKWEKIDETALKDAANAGAQVIAMIQFAPDWAQKYPGVACGPLTEAAMDKFARFMNALVSRYSQPPYNIRYWEIGNEPDIDHSLVPPHSGYGCWGEQSDPYYGGGYYAELLKATYGQVKKADPQANLLVGGLVLDCDPVNPPETSKNSGQFKNCASSRFLEGILKNGGGDYFDGVSFHAYDYYANQLGQYANPNWQSSWDTTGPVLIAKTRYLRSLLAEYGHSEKFLMNTEVALLCGRDGKEAICRSQAFDQTKAYYIIEANAAALAQGLRANVWYSLTGWRASGLVDGSLKPNLAYNAGKFSAAILEDATFAADVTGYPGVKGYQFNKDGKQIWLLWSLDGDSHTISLPSLPTHVFDAFGEALSTQKLLTITLAPVYLEW
jgi:hypothetical protein